ncbi:hypothetical protein AMATHDRAFT_57501 [Amanita thiersii Skay4041]|uniref:Uncharacterized protein n=1 Tax=Amanita thiersii Skay4041 TaxID=703135 RepID=A0A2A9NWP4_9AGAR|nr:hypothetical protein AMATHDRAFT_57501 [Amanita thiersii Skay4041]
MQGNLLDLLCLACVHTYIHAFKCVWVPYPSLPSSHFRQFYGAVRLCASCTAVMVDYSSLLFFLTRDRHPTPKSPFGERNIIHSKLNLSPPFLFSPFKSRVPSRPSDNGRTQVPTYSLEPRATYFLKHQSGKPRNHGGVFLSHIYLFLSPLATNQSPQGTLFYPSPLPDPQQ